MLYANTDEGSSALWVCDGNGIVVDNISIYGAERASILEQINEHYGTSFTDWSENEIGLRYGDTVPSWSTYEKIELPGTLVAIGQVAGDFYNFGEIKGETFIINVISNENTYICNRNGTNVRSGTFPRDQSSYDLIISTMVSRGYNVNAVKRKITVLEIGGNVPNWNDYIIVQ